MNIYLIIILVILIGDYILDLTVESLNVRNVNTSLPFEFKGWYDASRYKEAQEYLRDNTVFGIVTKTVITAALLIFILGGGFNWVDRFARGFNFGPILTGLIFAGILIFSLQIINILFSLYDTFVIEAKYGFNRTTPKTFLLDILKKWMLIAVIGSVVFSGVLWFFQEAAALAWVWCWVAVTLFQFFLMFIAPAVILPLFNKFIPLEDCPLKGSIKDYARQQNFKLKGIFKMDGSKRSTKSNAFFTGFGKYRRIVLFDTLIEKHTVQELTSVLAHEMGHFKKKHIFKHIAVSVATTGLMFFILSLFINNQGLFSAFKMENLSIYASLFFFAFLYSPINMIFSIAANSLSRKYEYEADRYAVETYRKPDAMISALKKLSVDNLSNLAPHPLKVFLEYSHPPVLERIKAIKELISP
ncbi:MAG: M48 family metallopeptidase [Candidatus Omnitrophota bacterium]|nr:MAG: M48 family metallopeptidase [Candidatus Omnitrophota bacterium]